jgi:hypothetical protein
MGQERHAVSVQSCLEVTVGGVPSADGTPQGR